MNFDWGEVCQRWPHLENVVTPKTCADRVTVLIGMENPAVHDIFEKRKLRSPKGILTPFGWCVVGPLEREPMTIPQCHNLQLEGPTDLDPLFDRFVDDDMFGAKPDSTKPTCLSRDDKSALSILKETTRFIGNRYEAGLLWRKEVPELPNNRVAVEQRFSSLERRFKTDSEMAKKYWEERQGSCRLKGQKGVLHDVHGGYHIILSQKLTSRVRFEWFFMPPQNIEACR